MKTEITDLAKERTERRLCEEVKGMNEHQREKYLSGIASLIEDMLSDEYDFDNYLGTDSSHRALELIRRTQNEL